MVSKQLESRFLGTDEKSISLQAHDFDLSNTIHTRNSLLEEINEDLQAILYQAQSNGSGQLFIARKQSAGSVSSFNADQAVSRSLFCETILN